MIKGKKKAGRFAVRSRLRSQGVWMKNKPHQNGARRRRDNAYTGIVVIGSILTLAIIAGVMVMVVLQAIEVLG